MANWTFFKILSALSYKFNWAVCDTNGIILKISLSEKKTSNFSEIENSWKWRKIEEKNNQSVTNIFQYFPISYIHSHSAVGAFFCTTISSSFNEAFVGSAEHMEWKSQFVPIAETVYMTTPRRPVRHGSWSCYFGFSMFGLYNMVKYLWKV